MDRTKNSRKFIVTIPVITPDGKGVLKWAKNLFRWVKEQL